MRYSTRRSPSQTLRPPPEARRVSHRLPLGVATILTTPVSRSITHAVERLLDVCRRIVGGFIPYVLDQLVLGMVGRASFALLLALLPTTAVLVGFLVLGQVPSAPEVLGIALVVVALVIRDRST